MTYELAKQLRDAGFPQNLGGGQMISLSGGLAPFEGDFYVPSLSELIEALGESYWQLYQTRNQEEGIFYVCETLSRIDGKGKTPEEAVAKLWLALQE